MGMDVHGRKPTTEAGEYFRANIWSWHPIHQLCETVLGTELRDWVYNDGAGFKTQKECDDLADRLEKYLDAYPEEVIELESKLRVDANGILTHGTGGRSVFHTSHEHVRKFIEFLRGCGGFTID